MISAFNWVGGKARMAPHLIKLLPAHRCYVEVFGGSAALLLAKPPSPMEVYNDIDSVLVNFFRVVRNPQQCKKLIRMLQWTPYSREEFMDAVRRMKEEEDPVEKARLFFYVSNASRNGLYTRKIWGIDPGENQSSSVGAFRRRIQYLKRIQERFQYVYVENLPYERILEIYDSEETCFYLDPPYLYPSRDRLYEHTMDEEDHRRMLERVLNLKGHVIISGYFSDLYSEYLKGWRLYTFDARVHSGSIWSESTRKTVECVWVKSTTPITLADLWEDQQPCSPTCTNC